MQLTTENTESHGENTENTEDTEKTRRTHGEYRGTQMKNPEEHSENGVHRLSRIYIRNHSVSTRVLRGEKEIKIKTL